MTSSNGNIFRVTGPLCGEFTGHRWIHRTKASDAELWCFLWSTPWIKGWVNNREAGDLRRYRAHYDVIVMRVLILWDILHMSICVHKYLCMLENIINISNHIFGIYKTVNDIYKYISYISWTSYTCGTGINSIKFLNSDSVSNATHDTQIIIYIYLFTWIHISYII